MIEWVQLSSLIIEQLFTYGPQIYDIFKSKNSKQKQLQLKVLSDDIAIQIQKNLLNELKKIMDHSVNIPLSNEDSEELNKVTKNIIEYESEKFITEMKDLIITEFNEILMDNLLCSPKYHNLLVVGTNQIYQLINKLFNDNFFIQDNLEKYQLFSTRKPEFRAGLLLYAINISDRLDLLEIKTNNEKKLKNEINNIEYNKEKKDPIKKITDEILSFIKNQNKQFKNDINRKISGIMICIDNKNEYKKIKSLIKNLRLSIEKNRYKIELYIIIINKCINIKEEGSIDIDIDENITQEYFINPKNFYDNKNYINNKNNIINFKEENKNINEIKYFNITIEEENTEYLDEEEDKNEIESFLNELVNKYIDDYMKDNFDNIYCTLNLQYIEKLKKYFKKIEKEFNKAIIEMKNFNLKNIPLKIEFESQIKKIFIDIFMNHIYPIYINRDINNIKKSQFSNKSLNLINDFFNYNKKKVKELTDKGKSEYTMRLIGEVKEKINELFNELELDKGEKEKLKDQNDLKKSFINNIIQLLNEKIEFSSDIYDLCLCYSYISKDLFKVLCEKMVEFCEKNIFQSKEFKQEINIRIIQQIDSQQRRVLNIN